MKQIRNTMIGMLCGVAAVSAAQTTTKAALTALYAKMDAMTVKMDGAGMKKFMIATTTKDFVYTDEQHKKQTLNTVLEDMAKQFSEISKITKSTSHIDTLVEKGDTATATLTSGLVFSAGGSAFVVNTKSQDVWVKSGGSWKMKSSATLKQTGTKDGKSLSGG